MSDENYAQIIVHKKFNNDFDQEGTLEFEWKGEPDWPFLVSVDSLQDHPDILSKLPWPVEQIGMKDEWTFIYRRKIKEEGNE